MISLLAVAVTTQVASAGPGAPWDYATYGPNQWAKDYPACGGKQQSPINIVTCETEKPGYGNRVISHNFWKKLKNAKYEMVNNGHSLQMNLPGDNAYRLSKGNQQLYRPLQVHIHFDPLTGKGSEHTLNSKRYFAEMHIVHANVKYDVASKEYLKHKDGLLVIGVFVDLIKKYRSGEGSLDFSIDKIASEEKVPNQRTSFAMALFGNAALELVEPESNKVVSSFPLGWLLPTMHRRKSQLSYVNYRGSLTTPPCLEIVDWIVLTGKTLEVNKDMANNLAKVMNHQGTHMAGNFRPIMDSEDREVVGVKGYF